MSRIGIYLASKPSDGGTFQYNKTILDALTNNNDIEVVIVCGSIEWFEYIGKNYGRHEKVLIERDFFSKLIFKLWRIVNENLDFWYAKLARITDFSKKIDAQNLELLICPSQDAVPYLITIPCIGTIHDLMHRYQKKFPEVSDNGEYNKREFHYKNICKFSKAILVDSKIGKKHVMESYGNELVNKIFSLEFTYPQYLAETDEAVVDIEVPEKYIFYPAQFWQHKNHLNLIKAIKYLKDKNVIISLVLVGSKKNGYENVLELIKNYNVENQIKILGYVDDKTMKFLYKNARALVMPTFFGPTNIPPLEAMFLGCPVLISRLYAMPEQVEDAGLLFDPENPIDIANCIEKIWFNEELYLNLVENGYRQIKKFSQEEFNVKFSNIIKKVLN